MQDWKVRAAKALDPALSEFLRLEGDLLQQVLARHKERCVNQVLLAFGKSALTVGVNPDDDSIDLRAGRRRDFEGNGWNDLSRRKPWKDHIGKPFGWGWITVNQQGYSDGLLLGFGDIRPRLMLYAVASSIKMASINFL